MTIYLTVPKLKGDKEEAKEDKDPLEEEQEEETGEIIGTTTNQFF